jgi:hypothetical protein
MCAVSPIRGAYCKSLLHLAAARRVAESMRPSGGTREAADATR